MCRILRETARIIIIVYYHAMLILLSNTKETKIDEPRLTLKNRLNLIYRLLSSANAYIIIY